MKKKIHKLIICGVMIFLLSASSSTGHQSTWQVGNLTLSMGGCYRVGSHYSASFTVGETFIGGSSTKDLNLALGFWAVNGANVKTDSGNNRGSGTPNSYKLEANYPNPFNPATTIQYALPERAHVRLTIYNILGQEVISLVDREQAAGCWEVQWDGKGRSGSPAATGIYLYQLKTDEFCQTKKMLLLK